MFLSSEGPEVNSIWEYDKKDQKLFSLFIKKKKKTQTDNKQLHHYTSK